MEWRGRILLCKVSICLKYKGAALAFCMTYSIYRSYISDYLSFRFFKLISNSEQHKTTRAEDTLCMGSTHAGYFYCPCLALLILPPHVKSVLRHMTCYANEVMMSRRKAQWWAALEDSTRWQIDRLLFHWIGCLCFFYVNFFLILMNFSANVKLNDNIEKVPYISLTF